MDGVALPLIRNRRTRFFIWRGNDDHVRDHVHVVAGAIPLFLSKEELLAYSAPKEISINQNAKTVPLDFDAVMHWVDGLDDCSAKLALGAWNLLKDVHSIDSPKWKEFRSLSEENQDLHYELSGRVITRQLRDEDPGVVTTSSMPGLQQTLRAGIEAFDSSIVEMKEA
jgi:hypothetical protein